MRILFTGGTSFTGFWFIRALAAQGHQVSAVMRGVQDGYRGLRGERLGLLAGQCRFIWNAPFGSPAFMEAIDGPFDVLCHHAAEVKDYKSPDFDVEAAVAANTCQLPPVLQQLRGAGCRRVILTGSIFEAGEGSGTMPLKTFSPYGLSKTLTSEIFRQETAKQNIALGKFVIPNPFGPYEEARFTHYLMSCWKDGKPARIQTPDYVRDNVPVSLLAAAYARFAGQARPSAFARLNPSYYAETQGAFARRFAGEMGRRLQMPVPLEFAEQTDFPEPLIRINTDCLRGEDFGWSEDAFWDETAQYYAERLNIRVR